MPDSVLDTTILANALLKSGVISAAAKAAARRYPNSLLPVYAVKELKAGPLNVFVYVHNKFKQTHSFDNGLTARHGLVLSPRRNFPATFVEALREIAKRSGKLTTAQLEEKYG